jgi:3-deoxy-D-arabino-heptulosonate 7-phosphate (DAHP) synthase class II
MQWIKHLYRNDDCCAACRSVGVTTTVCVNQTDRHTNIFLMIYEAALCRPTETHHLKFTFSWSAHCLAQGTIHVGSRPTDISQPSTVAIVMTVYCHQAKQNALTNKNVSNCLQLVSGLLRDAVACNRPTVCDPHTLYWHVTPAKFLTADVTQTWKNAVTLQMLAD